MFVFLAGDVDVRGFDADTSLRDACRETTFAGMQTAALSPPRLSPFLSRLRRCSRC